MRIYWVDFLRLLSAIAVITIHSGSNVYATLDPSTGEWWLSNILMTAAKSTGTAIFVMIAGYILLGKELDYTEFYKSRARRILVPLVFWSIFYSIFLFIFIDDSVSDLVWRLTIGLLLSGSAYFHLWYLSMFIWLMLLTPLLAKMLRGTPPDSRDLKIFFAISVAFFSMSSLSSVKEEVSEQRIIWFTDFGVYIFYFVMGHLIPKHINSVKIRENYLLLAYLSILASGMLLNYIMVSKGFRDDNMIFGNKTIFGFIAVMLLFTYIVKLKPGKAISIELHNAAKSSFGVYLIHPLILFFISKATAALTLDLFSAVFLNIMTTIILSFFAVHWLRKTSLGRQIT